MPRRSLPAAKFQNQGSCLAIRPPFCVSVHPETPTRCRTPPPRARPPEGTREKGLAEAAAIEARRTALAENAEGVVAQQIAEQLPAIVAAAARQYDDVGSLTMLDGAEGLNRGLLSTVGVASAIMPIAKGLFDATNDAAQAVSGDRPKDRRPAAKSGESGYRTTTAKPKDGPTQD